jgi:hypothetical protein
MAATVPPPSAPIVTWLAVPSRTTIVSTAQAAAPAVMPMMSGLASGLRAMRWKIAPERPKAAPTRTAAKPRGSRRVRTTKSVSGRPWPTSVATTSPNGIGNSPTASDQANTTRATATSTEVTTSGRTARRAETPRRTDRTTRAPWGPRRVMTVTDPPASGGARGR